MKGDFSRWTFSPRKNYSRVLLQQGRPQLDADWNEQVAILLRNHRILSRDLIGPHGGPADHCGFGIDELPEGPLDFLICDGRYYVNGICCENHSALRFSEQPLPFQGPPVVNGKHYLVYLDTWEELVTAADDPDLFEPALGGFDTAARSQVVWQVLTREVDPTLNRQHVLDNWKKMKDSWHPRMRGTLRVRMADPSGDGEPPQEQVRTGQRYRGTENQLYRIEIHHGGRAQNGPGGATFKWSRENGSIMLPVLALKDSTVTLGGFDSEGWSTLAPGDWLESVTGPGNPTAKPSPLVQVKSRGPGRDQVTLELGEGIPDLDLVLNNRVRLRRWDHRAGRTGRSGVPLHEGAIPVVEGDAHWLAIENGIEVQFAPGDSTFRTGDYWLIPARTAEGGKVLWPQQGGLPQAMGPHGVEHAYAPLALIEFTPTARLKQSCRWQFQTVPLSAV